MRPQERRLLRRLMIFASVLVAMMVTVTLWLAFQDTTRTPPPSGAEPGASTGAGETP
jgi:hypothetical protein